MCFLLLEKQRRIIKTGKATGQRTCGEMIVGICSLDLKYGSLGEEEQGRGNAGKCAGSLESRKDQNTRTCNAAAPTNVGN